MDREKIGLAPWRRATRQEGRGVRNCVSPHRVRVISAIRREVWILSSVTKGCPPSAQRLTGGCVELFLSYESHANVRLRRADRKGERL